MTYSLSVNTDEVTEAAPTPKQLEDEGQAIVDDIIELNLGTVQEPRPIYINALLSLEERE